MQVIPNRHQIGEAVIQWSARLALHCEEILLVADRSGLGSESVLPDTATSAAVLVEVGGPRFSFLACRHIA
ncbi:hypothetical protein D9M68_582840 [compost metagenome]